MKPPEGSRLSVEWIDGQQTIVAPPPSRGAMAIFVAMFVLFWLGGWTFGGIQAARTLVSGRASNSELFLGFWLAGWALGEGFALFTLYRIVRPTIPERFTLRLREGGDANRLTVDVGAARFDLAKECAEVEREWLFQTLSDHYRLADDWRKS